MRIKLSLLVLLAIVGLGGAAIAQTSSISYRGRLTASDAPANGAHDIEFKLFTSAEVGSGTQQGATITQPAVAVANGVFSAALDFGPVVFDGSPLFLEISVRPTGAPIPFTTLAPRQQVASIPYSLHSLSAGSAASLGNGAAVLSLNNLKDNVTLAAGPNVTITPSGNILTIASTGGGQSSPWSLNGADTYYTAGNVGIGASAVTPGIRLEVSGAALLKPGNGNIQFGSPNAELGMSIIPNGGNRADLRFDGSALKLLAGSGVAPPPAANGMAITTGGNVGIGTVAPDAKLHVEKTQPGTSVYGHALGAGGVGVYGHAPNPGGLGVLGSAGSGGIGVYAGNTAGGTAVHADGNATQKADKGGFVKAMAYIDPFLPVAQYVVRCYNSQQADNAASAAPCGIQVGRLGPGEYLVDFGFNIEDRFISLTPQASGLSPSVMSGMIYAVNKSAIYLLFRRGDAVEDSRFHIIVY